MLNNFFDKLWVDPKELVFLEKEVNTLNLKRIYLLSILGLPLTIIHIIVFGYDLSEATDEKYYWQLGIVLNNIFTFIFLLTVAILSKKFHLDSLTKDRSKASRILVWSSFIILLCLGSVVVGIDQAVTSSITPFLVACTVTSVVFLVRPRYSIIGFLFGFLVFYLILVQTQPNPDIRLSNIMNGITSICIGIGISMVMWFGNMERLQQQRTIALQKAELEKNYDILVENSKQLKEANETKDKFFSIVTHDIKSPLAGIIGALNLVKESSNKEELLFHDGFLELIYQSSARTERLLDNLVLWSQSQTNRLVFNPITINIADLLQENLQLHEATIVNKEIKITNAFSEKDFVNGDKEMINAIFRNLLSNAIKFTPRSGQIFLNSKIIKVDDRQMLQIEVRDSGVGMTKKQINDLLQIKSSLTTEGTEMELGTGLGLMICKEFIGKHQGELIIESELGVGSSFIFSLPLI
ncbi:ATP-binding protein [Fulvivirgaceae bacterium LMO-SS25]